VFTDAELLSLPIALRGKAEAMTAQLKHAEFKVKALEAELRRERILKYGAASEKLHDGQLELLETEPGVSPREIQLEAALPASEKQATEKVRRKATRGHGTLPAELPREEEVIACRKEDCICPCCQGTRKVIGYETSERLDRVPARYVVKVIKREKRACGNCEEGGVTTAALPPQIIRKGIATNRLVVDVLLSKYEMHLPLYRQEVQMSRESGVELTRQTMCGWVMECGFLLQAVRREMLAELLLGGYIQADETPIGVQSASVQGRNHRGYLWEFSRPGGSVIFDYQDGRGREGPRKILSSYRGVLQTDDYSVYDKLGIDGIEHAACMAHVRRKFVEAARVYPEDKDLVAIVRQIGLLYAVEEQARREQLGPHQRQALRNQLSVGPMKELKSSILALRTIALPQSMQGKACNYTLGLWSKLEVYLRNGQIEIDNNWCENAIRPIAIGRKNWLHFGSKEAGPNIAAILSVVETCHRLKVPVREYLLDIMPKLSAGQAREVAAMTPAAWLAARQ
jgi:transposase